MTETVTPKKQLPKKPTSATGILFWWLKKLFWLGGRTICPRCEKGEMFESHFQVRKQCPECKVVLQPYSGDELGVIALGYFMVLGPSLIGLVLAYFYTQWTGGQLLAFFFLLMTFIMLAFYKNIKGIWIAFVYLLTGFKKRL